MSQLKITKVSEADERCWGVELLDDSDLLLRSRMGVSKGEVMLMANTLKSKGPEAPLSEDGKEQADQAAWIIEKTRGGLIVRFTLVTTTEFELLLKLEIDAELPKGAEEAIALVRKSLTDADIVWDPPEDKPPSPPIKIEIDNEPHEAPENPMTVNDILRLGDLDPDSNYLVQIKDGERIKYEGKGNQLIVLYEGAEFVGHYTGAKGVSSLDG